MAVLSTQSRRVQQMIYLESKGWVFFNNSADVPYIKLGELKVYDFEAAVDHQRHLEEVAYREKHKAKPRYHWGLDAALAMGANR